MGGAAFIASRAGVPVYASRIEAALCNDPLLEPSFLWGAFPPPELRGKFFMAPACAAVPLNVGAAVSNAAVPLPAALAGLEVLPLGGHFFGQIGFLAEGAREGGILFAGDAVFGPESLAKHPLFFVYDVAAFLESLARIQNCGARVVLPSHGEATEDVAGLCAANRAAVERIAAAIIDACASTRDGASAEDVLALLCPRFGFELGWAQYALVGSTVRSFLVYLRALGELEAGFADGRLRWRRK
jgi:glyoxylase-like metal-dependent hydrolase (beta-lactamase superfamily II)